MFVVVLRFSTQKEQAGAFIDVHKAWIDQGIHDGVFLLVGSLKPNGGGVVLAHNVSRVELERRVNLDPVVEHGVVTAEIIEIAPSKVDERLRFLVGTA
ncbi:MAG TPA: hypothetical protein VG963_08280 [Polyangiaceae bacterium]|nr:hypothetical protein [Polyangiaceae bacterium]